jgi:hypothetical protein
MKHLPLFALVFAAALVVVALIAVPSCIDLFFETPPDWKAQREETSNRAELTIRKFEARHGDKPLEEWPELDRQTYRNARRILGEMAGNP